MTLLTGELFQACQTQLSGKQNCSLFSRTFSLSLSSFLVELRGSSPAAMSCSKVTALFLLVCTIGCCYQVALLTIQYMEYGISSEVKLIFDKTIRLPAVTWCPEVLHSLNWTHPLVRSNCVRILGIRNCSQMEETLIIRQIRRIKLKEAEHKVELVHHLLDVSQLFEATISIDSLIRLAAIVDTNTQTGTSFKQVTELFHVTEFMLRSTKCFTLNWKSGWDTMEASKLRKGTHAQGLYVLLFYAGAMDQRDAIYRFAYSDNRYRHLRTGVADFVYAPNSGLVISSYDVYRSRLLHAPFVTDCVDYAAANTSDQAECLDVCMERKAVLRFGMKWRGQRAVPQDKGVRMMSIQQMREHRAGIREIEDCCNSKCAKQDCHQEIIVTNVRTSTSKTEAVIDGHASYAPNSPIVVTEASPKVTLTEFLTVTGSCFGFWFGLSVLQGLQFLATASTRIRTVWLGTTTTVRTRRHRRPRVACGCPCRFGHAGVRRFHATA